MSAAIATSEIVATSIIAYAEARSGLARRMREGDFTRREYADIIAGLENDWVTFARVPVLDSIARQAGEVAQRYTLRGCDAIHLASALYLADRFEELRFMAFDHRLNNAATKTGLSSFD